MISIIVIGRNEGWRLTKCLNSISVIKNTYTNLDFEIVYVDSHSIDDSIERAKTLNGIKIYKLTGEMNAAIARNVGAQESIGEILFFVDGDMELQSDFLHHAINEKKELKYDVLTGHLDDYFYNLNDEFIGSAPRTYSKDIPKTVQELTTNGGIFLIKKNVWVQLGGMNSKFKVNEDIDFSIRLDKKGIVTKRFPHLITKHHTVDYRNETRMWTMLKRGYGLYPGLIFREHVLNTYVFKKVIRSQYTALLLMPILITAFLNQLLLLVATSTYILILLLRTFMNMRSSNIERNKFIYFFERLLLQFLLDISFWIGFLMFYPKNKKEEYTPINIY